MAEDYSRRDFLKVGTLASGVAAAVGLGIGSIVGVEGTASAKEAITTAETEFVYRCPVCGKQYSDWKALKAHFDEAHPDAAVPEMATLSINGNELKVQIEPHWTLRDTLQFALDLTGSAKEMCDRGACGSCTVLIDGKPALSCTTLACECEGRQIETVESIAADETWKPLVDAYVKYDAMQCGYCTPGNLAVAKYLITNNPDPTEEEIRTALSGNICRCGTYARHVLAIQEAAAIMRGETPAGSADSTSAIAEASGSASASAASSSAAASTVSSSMPASAASSSAAASTTSGSTSASASSKGGM